LSPDALAVVEVAAALLEELVLEALLLEVALELEEDEPPSFLVELYRSEYQPPPLRWKLERLTTLVSEPWAPQAVQAAGVGSEIFWRTSIVFPQLWQAYS